MLWVRSQRFVSKVATHFEWLVVRDLLKVVPSDDVSSFFGLVLRSAFPSSPDKRCRHLRVSSNDPDDSSDYVSYVVMGTGTVVNAVTP